MDPKERIIIALDVSDKNEALDIIKLFEGQISTFKVGAELFTMAGPDIVKEIRSRGNKVFLDLKYHDIPNTVKKATINAASLGASMITLHTLGGLEMMKTAAQALIEFSLRRNLDRPKLLGVTVLTSINQNILRDEMGMQMSLTAQVKHLANLAKKAGLDGVVASSWEIDTIRPRFGKDFLIVAPGIRTSSSQKDDQMRTLTPREALIKGADYIVLGRAVLTHPDPFKALERIISELSGL
jgi:orotidine-5'-phosphate decarboxylase